MHTWKNQLKVRHCNLYQFAGKFYIQPHALDWLSPSHYKNLRENADVDAEFFGLEFSRNKTHPLRRFYTGISGKRRSCDAKIIPIPPSQSQKHYKTQTKAETNMLATCFGE
jgi:hypothetical protein